MSKKFVFVYIISCALLFMTCLYASKKTITEQVVEMYKDDVDSLNIQVAALVKLVETKASREELHLQFKKARIAYKKTEWLAEYYNAYTAKQINGPALEEVEADEKTKIIQPEGFQVVEELLFPMYDEANHTELLAQTKILQSNAGRLKYISSSLETTDAHIFDALRLQVFRIITLGISGFDSPIANNSIPEALASLQTIEKYYSFYKDDLSNKDESLAEGFDKLFEQSNRLLSVQQYFNSFDRMKFITDCLNPLSKNLLAAQKQLNIPVFSEPRFLKADAPTLFAQNIFNTDFYSPGTDYYSSNEKVSLGEKLFYDGVLSGDGKRSCATCHQPGKAFTDGLKTSMSVTGRSVRRNSPTLLNAGLQPSLFYDTRVSFLEDQAKDVINNKDEMHGSLDKAVQYINNHKAYKKLFNSIYPNSTVSELHIKNVIASYVRSLISLNSRFDQYVRGDKSAMSKIEVDGFNLFMGKAKCGTCHFAPLFNGSNPPVFGKIDAEVIGVPATSDTLQPFLDNDEGKYGLYKVDIHKHAFKTPTVRNIELTAPYMHNGVYKTLEEVVEFYSRGGGAGLGLKVENQTLPSDKLHLSAYEKKALVSFMKSLTDTGYKTERVNNKIALR